MQDSKLVWMKVKLARVKSGLILTKMERLNGNSLVQGMEILDIRIISMMEMSGMLLPLALELLLLRESCSRLLLQFSLQA